MTVSAVPPVLSDGTITGETIALSWTEAEGSPRAGASFEVQKCTSTPIANNHLWTFEALSAPYTFFLNPAPNVLPGTVTLNLFTGGVDGTPDDALTDDGAGVLTGTDSSGTINYVTGSVSFTTTLEIITCYAIWISYDGSAPWSSAANVAINVSACVSSGLTPLTTHYHRVRAKDGNGSGPWSYFITSATIEASPLAPDPNLGTIYRIHDGLTTARTGTVTLNGTTDVVGSGTAFNTEFVVGDVIVVNDEARIVATITDSDNLTVGTAFTQSASGQVYTGYRIVSVTSLASGAMTRPASSPQAYSASKALLDGTVLGLGWGTTEWRWGFLTQAQYDALRTLCPGKSVATYIDTLDDARDFQTYSAVMVWPDKPDFYGQKWSNFVLTFRKMELV